MRVVARRAVQQRGPVGEAARAHEHVPRQRARAAVRRAQQRAAQPRRAGLVRRRAVELERADVQTLAEDHQ